MKKWFFLLLLPALLLSACGQSVSAPVTAPAPTAVPTAAVSESTPVPLSAALSQQLDQLRTGVQPGTAGSSLKAAAVVASLLDWAEEPPAQEIIDATLAHWLSQQSEEARALLPEQVASLDYTLELLTADYSHADGLLSDAGLTGRGPWSRDAARTVRSLFDALLAE